MLLSQHLVCGGFAWRKADVQQRFKATALGMNKHTQIISFHESMQYKYDRTAFLSVCVCIYVIF